LTGILECDDVGFERCIVAVTQKAQVFLIDQSQVVRIPDECRFSTDEAFVERGPSTGTLRLSEKTLRLSLSEIFSELDAAGASDFDLVRDRSEPNERERM
jgi:virulence-associated protein VagC